MFLPRIRPRPRTVFGNLPCPKTWDGTCRGPSNWMGAGLYFSFGPRAAEHQAVRVRWFLLLDRLNAAELRITGAGDSKQWFMRTAISVRRLGSAQRVQNSPTYLRALQRRYRRRLPRARFPHQAEPILRSGCA